MPPSWWSRAASCGASAAELAPVPHENRTHSAAAEAYDGGMTHRAAVGESQSRDSEAAGREATLAALDGTGGQADALLVFATAGHDQEALLRGIREVAADVPMAGCTGAGIITRAGSDEGTHAVGVLALRAPGLRFEVLAERGLSEDAEAAGARLGEAAARLKDPRVLFLFPDGLTGNITALLRGLGRTAPPGVLVFGGAAGEVSRFEHTYQYADGVALEDSAVALIIEGDLELEVAVSHGCKLLGIDHRVTRAEGGAVFELDDQPAWEVMREYVDGPRDRFSGSDVPYLCVAQPLPEDHPAYGKMIIRVPLGLDPGSGALFFPGELRTGETLGMARRDADEVVARAVESSRELFRRESPPLFVLQADCAGRGRLLFGEQVTAKIITPVQQAARHDGAWLGFHSYGEIAPVGGQTYYHNYTMALCAAYVRATA